MTAARSKLALDFLARQAAADVPSLVADFQQTVRAFGFTASAGGAFVGIGQNRFNRFFFNDWPQDWIERYIANGFVERDPIVLESRRRISPFQWSEMLDEPSFRVEGADVWAAGLDYGWRDGFSVPIHGPGGYQGLISMAAMQVLALPAEDRSLLQAMAHVVHDRCRRTSDPVQPLPTAFTLREIQCMQWVAAGKSDWEIAKLIGISPATAHFHVERVKKRLGLKSRTQAVALLVLHGLI